MSDTWSSIQAHKKQLDSLRERLQRRRKQEPLDLRNPELALSPPFRSDSPVPSSVTPSTATESGDLVTDPELEKKLLHHLSDLGLALPTDALSICLAISTPEAPATQRSVESLLQKFAAQELIEVKRGLLQEDDQPMLVTYADHSKLSAMMGAVTEKKGTGEGAGAGAVKRRAEQDTGASISTAGASPSISTLSEPLREPPKKSRKQASDLDLEIESLLSQQSTKEQQSKKVSQEILELLNTTTAKEQSIVEKFRSRGRAQVQEFCDYGTKEECMKANDAERPCRKLHFRRIINKHTDESLGDCSFLNTCFHMDTCKYVHYEIDACADLDAPCGRELSSGQELALPQAVGRDSSVDRLFPPQWICCDIRYLDVSILGKFAVVMADPPWDIHMELPYGTLTDDEMRRLNIPVLQDEGFLFLWVTGRAMELGRECLNLWGYERVDEIIWVKTNQLQRIIRTGRTGHWLNHGKEHCLVGVKGNPQGFNRGLDCDVIVAEVRSTSHKPDEIYGMIERLSPGTRKIELFGRPHNVQPNWITLGNQLDGIHLLDPDVVAQFKQRYPDGIISKPKNM
ncbi:N6-adenosine-methyltransferase catalytic subunit [Anolis carolinensis]|uniref:mRNA m(6)A methyltransferase n=1 Tax=Anolis carolinensis TaxID=28377 RepID=H9G6T9_ANOCA|nr:PREDICTED: N6-adenosine-methyltransferase 70 kDa subunit [Anolis carolinensis]|eukprot:XP_003227278.1 PREDICTED: N6-adenosine-methyltransferase 70 kDa subunit [Anolis carolinensis]